MRGSEREGWAWVVWVVGVLGVWELGLGGVDREKRRCACVVVLRDEVGVGVEMEGLGRVG